MTIVLIKLYFQKCNPLFQAYIYINLLIRQIDSKINKRKINNNSDARAVQQGYNIGYTFEI